MSEINHKTIENVIYLPVVALRGLVGFPAIQMNIEIVRPVSLKAFTACATLHDAKVILLTQKDISVEDPKADDFYSIGILAEIKHVVKNPQGNLSVIFEGISRVQVTKIEFSTGFFVAATELVDEKGINSISKETEATIYEIRNNLKNLKDIHPNFTDELRLTSEAITDPGYFADFVASSALIDYKNKQAVLEAFSIKRRLSALLVALEEEMMLLECERDIQIKVREKIDKNQKDYFLREQIKAIQNELGDEDEDEITEYDNRIYESDIPENVKEKLYKELSKLSKTPFGAAEGTVIRSYLDTCLEFPFGKRTSDEVNVEDARKILNEDHDGLDKVKERILEFVAIKHFSPNVRSQIICLVGPPGVGKTSVAASIARALGRKYARVSLGGMHDEAEIRGHRKTYVGAMPGRIVSALINAKVENPVIVLDEIDKMAKDFRGDPTSALLEVLDPEQNKSFRDNFMEIPIDLSNIMFIATANSYEGIPTPLLDRMEIIELSTYTDTEKLAIAKNHLVPKKLGLKVFLQAGYMPEAVLGLPADHALRYIYPVKEGEEKGRRVFCRHEGISFVEHNSGTFLDMFHEVAMEHYLKVSYEEMWQEFADEYGKTVTSVWVDEPSYDAAYLPWTPKLETLFRETFGCDLVDKIWMLYYDAEGCHTVRYHYRTLMRDLLEQNYFRKVRDWCHDHDLMFSGHLMMEDTLQTQISRAQACMP